MNVTITSSRLRDIAVNRLEKALGRQVRMEELKINLWRRIELKGLSVENPKDFQPGDFVRVETLIVRYRLLPLLRRRWEGSLNINGGEIKLLRIGVPLSNIEGKLEIKGNKISVSELKANLGKGTVGLQGQANNKGESFLNLSRLAYSFRVDWQNLNMDTLLSSTKFKGMLLGKLEGRASFQGEQLSPEAVSGQGELQIKEGRLRGIPLMQLLVSLLGLPSLAEVDFQEFYTDFSLEDEIVRTDNLRLLSQDIDMFVKGTFDFETNLDYKLTIRLSPEISADFPLQSLYPRDEEGRTIIETPLTGTFRKPKLELLKTPVERIIRKGFKELLNIFGE